MNRIPDLLAGLGRRAARASRCGGWRAGLAGLLFSGTVYLPLVNSHTPMLWTQVNDPGFNEHAGPYTGQEGFDLAVFNDQLYLGMEGRACARIWRSRAGVREPAGQADWEQVVDNGFDGTTDCALAPPTTDNDHIDSLEPFGGFLYASTAMQTGEKRGTQVWRSASGAPGSWVRVNEPGFGQSTNANFKDMTAFAGLLCGGTGNRGADGVPAGAQVWCTDGVTRDPDRSGQLAWLQRNVSGFGDPANVKIWSSAVHAGALYFGVEADSGVGSVWRTRDISDPTAWEKVFGAEDTGLPARRVDVLQGFNGELYIGMEVSGQGTHLYRSASGDRFSWQPSVTDGFGSPTAGRVISDASTELSGALYVGVLDESRGASVWTTRDGRQWSRVSPYGFGDPATFAAELIGFQGHLYAWTSNYAEGQGVWHRK